MLIYRLNNAAGPNGSSQSKHNGTSGSEMVDDEAA
jgi:hypothetical protein